MCRRQSLRMLSSHYFLAAQSTQQFCWGGSGLHLTLLPRGVPVQGFQRLTPRLQPGTAVAVAA